MSVRYRSALAVLALVLPLAACLKAYEQPEVRLEGIRVGSIGLRGGLLYAQVHVENPNRFDLETSGLSYDLQLADPSSDSDWVSFAKGVLDEPIRVRSHDQTVIELPIQFRFQDLGGAVKSILDNGTFNYRVSGDVRLKEPIGKTIPYRKSGVVTMTGIR
jgi:LEA14-like dessication related protein